MRMVFENLIDNAHKYTYEEKAINISCSIKRSSVEIKIMDEGVGIGPEYLPKLFHKFSRIDNPLSTQAGGTGLGLYWAQKIVSLHDGKLQVESKVGIGTTFIVSLPKH
jgi:two-component system phosphate regulon sensor histidine kinase PhoR